ncbi:PP2C family serine/threonine-protein phosphatase [Acidipila sp. EB88]|uniref:PP2C family protein-serine/threonine phosphatase n=1 Tax=Acidipila sp. EB88 TaxID=2305226 RepID=UPI001F31A7FC|nr:PP2C family serine/threonine-protein phosphatase [Acidipila sp. EB88]
MSIALHPTATALTHVGQVRRTNQDAWSYSLEAGLFAVCDGMGGMAGGEIASQIAVEAFVEHLAPVPEAQRTARLVTQAVCAANRRVQARAAHERALQGMGTTLVALALCAANKAAIVHVGDSRCYRWRHGSLEACTEDHSLIAEQIRNGVLTEAQAALSPMRNVITRAVGTRRSVLPEVQMLLLEPGDVFLLCSDGLCRELPDAAIAGLLRGDAPLPERNRALVEAALAAGGRDNVTSMLVRIE